MIAISATTAMAAAQAATFIGGTTVTVAHSKKIKKLEGQLTKAKAERAGIAGGLFLVIGAQICDNITRGKQIKQINESVAALDASYKALGNRVAAVEASVNAINSRPPAYVIQPAPMPTGVVK